MKRILSLVLAMVMVLGTFSVGFAAETTVEKTAIEILNELEVILGDERGLRPNDPLAREEAVVMIARLKGAIEEAQKWETAPTWTDVPNHYKSILGWGQEDKTFEGHSATNFGFGEAMTAKQYAVVLLKILGYSDVTWDKVEEMAKDVMKLENLDAKFTRGSMADMTLVALGTNVKGEEVTLAEELGLEIELPAVEVAFAITEVKATKANVLTVTFNQAVDTENTTLKVTRGASAVTGKAVWNAEKTVATFTADANMIKGTYTVEATIKAEGADDVVVTGSTDVVSQFVNEIVILNDVALTGTTGVGTANELAAGEAYAYYDVLDQYGESVRNTTNITWSSSVKHNVNRTTGKITLTRSDDKAFTYNEQIFLSGVDTKTGVNVTKTLTVGQAQALNSVAVAGFVKKGTTEILKVLPSGFKAGTYNMVFTIQDQNGNPFTVASYTALKDQVTFVSDNPLVISEIAVDTVNGSAVVIDGVEYHTALVKPGMNVDRGGEVNILAIATKTGNKFTINTVVGEHQILTSFELLSPTVIVADHEKDIEIPFNAFDQHGEKITNFTTIARNETFNTLTLTTSDTTTLTLVEEDDGTAGLYFSDKDMNWAETSTTDGLDRVVSLTSIVVGGNTSNLMLNIQDKARPMGIKEIDMENVLVHGGSTTLTLEDDAYTNSFTFVDQYGRDMKRANALAFFAATFAGHNQDFAGYKFGVRGTYKGTAGNYSVTSSDNNVAYYLHTEDMDNDDWFILYNTGNITLDANKDLPTAAKTGMSIRFDIVKTKTVEGDFKVEGVSPVKTEALTIINIKQVRAIEVKAIGKAYIPTTNSVNLTGENLITTPGAITTNVTTADLLAIPTDHQRKASVVGKYNNEDVTIPNSYVGKSAKSSGTAIKLDLAEVKNAKTGAKELHVVAGADLRWSDLYDATSARFTRKDAEDTITVDIYTVENDSSERLTTASRVVTFSDATPRLTTITGKDALTVNPEQTKIEVKTSVGATTNPGYKYLDQYSVAIGKDVRYRVSSVVENPDGYAANNFTYIGNDTGNLVIEGAERGDTFVITILASYEGITVTKEVKVTVGADTNANIGSGSTGNVYLNLLIKGTKDNSGKIIIKGLEDQRLETLN